jgi:hypothetical protein
MAWLAFLKCRLNGISWWTRNFKSSYRVVSKNVIVIHIARCSNISRSNSQHSKRKNALPLLLCVLSCASPVIRRNDRTINGLEIAPEHLHVLRRSLFLQDAIRDRLMKHDTYTSMIAWRCFVLKDMTKKVMGSNEKKEITA